MTLIKICLRKSIGFPMVGKTKPDTDKISEIENPDSSVLHFSKADCTLSYSIYTLFFPNVYLCFVFQLLQSFCIGNQFNYLSHSES